MGSWRYTYSERKAPGRTRGGNVLNLENQVGAAPGGLGFPIRSKALRLAHPSTMDSRSRKDDIGSEIAATYTGQPGAYPV